MLLMLLTRHPIQALIATILIVDIVVGSVVLASELNGGHILPENIGFGFYRKDNRKG